MQQETTSYFFCRGLKLQVTATLQPNTQLISLEVSEVGKRKYDSEILPQKKMKLYMEKDFTPTEHELVLNQKDVFCHVLSFIPSVDLIDSCQLVCKLWNDWISSSTYLWQTRYFKQWGIEGTVNGSNSDILPFACFVNRAKETHDKIVKKTEPERIYDWILDYCSPLKEFEKFIFFEKPAPCNTQEVKPNYTITNIVSNFFMVNVKGEPSITRFEIEYSHHSPPKGYGRDCISLVGDSHRLWFLDASVDYCGEKNKLGGNDEIEFDNTEIIKVMQKLGLYKNTNPKKFIAFLCAYGLLGRERLNNFDDYYFFEEDENDSSDESE